MREEPPCRLVGGHSDIVTQYNLKRIQSQTYTSSRDGQLTGPSVLQPHCAGSEHKPKIGGRYGILGATSPCSSRLWWRHVLLSLLPMCACFAWGTLSSGEPKGTVKKYHLKTKDTEHCDKQVTTVEKTSFVNPKSVYSLFIIHLTKLNCVKHKDNKYSLHCWFELDVFSWAIRNNS